MDITTNSQGDLIAHDGARHVATAVALGDTFTILGVGPTVPAFIGEWYRGRVCDSKATMLTTLESMTNAARGWPVRG